MWFCTLFEDTFENVWKHSVSGGCRRFEEAENTRVGHADAFADANQMRINVNRCESSAYCAKIIISFVTKKLPFWLRFSKSLGPEAQLTNALCTYGVSPSQVPRPFCETLMSWGTWLGFSPVCVRRWVFRFPEWVKDLLHTMHLCGFSPLWVTMWLFSFPFSLNDLLQCAQA